MTADHICLRHTHWAAWYKRISYEPLVLHILVCSADQSNHLQHMQLVHTEASGC